MHEKAILGIEKSRAAPFVGCCQTCFGKRLRTAFHSSWHDPKRCFKLRRAPNDVHENANFNNVFLIHLTYKTYKSHATHFLAAVPKPVLRNAFMWRLPGVTSCGCRDFMQWGLTTPRLSFGDRLGSSSVAGTQFLWHCLHLLGEKPGEEAPKPALLHASTCSAQGRILVEESKG